MNNNNNLFIYKINIGDMCYIGSTKDIHMRMLYHKSVCYNEKCRNYNLKLYKTIREHYGTDWNKVIWNVVDCYYNVDKTFRNEIEQYYIVLFKSELNMRGVIFIGMKQYQNQYRIKNRDIIKERQKQKITCICGSIISKTNTKQHENSKKHKNYLLKNNNN